MSYLLSRPFWNDEEWVVISTKLPLRDLARDSASTPVGWLLLLRVMVLGGEQRYRLVPLAFAALGAVAAFGFARSLPWRHGWFALIPATIAGLVVEFAPSTLIRNDLKQYTADAFVTLLVLWMLSRLENSWSRRRFAALAATVVLGFLISAAAAFAGVAALTAYGLACLFQRRWRRLAEALAGSAAAGLLLGGIYLLAYRPGVPPGLTEYWSAYYLPVHKGWGPSLNYLWRRARYLSPFTGVRQAPVALGLFGAGVVTLGCLRRPAVALSVPLLLAEMITLGALKQYPLFDERTSHFLLMAMAVVGAVGVAGACALLARVHFGIALAAGLAAAVVFVASTHAYVRSRHLPFEDLRTPAEYVSKNLRPGDVILLSSLSSWGFTYYWPGSKPARLPSDANLQRFVTTLPSVPDFLQAADRTDGPVEAALARALAQQRRNGPSSRIWLVREHVTQQEKAAWLRAFGDLRVDPESIDGTRLMIIDSN